LLTPQVSQAASASQEAALEENGLPLSRGDVFTIHAIATPTDNEPDYPTSLPQSKGNCGELFRSAQYAVLEPSKLPVRNFGVRRLAAPFIRPAERHQRELPAPWRNCCSHLKRKARKVQVTLLNS
jgi:hypothetical protein